MHPRARLATVFRFNECVMESFPLSPPRFSGNARKVPLINAFDWISHGWETFLAAPKFWLTFCGALLFFWFAIDVLWLVNLQTTLLPADLRFLASFLLLMGPIVLLPPVIAGGLRACRKIEKNDAVTMADMLWGFSAKRRAMLGVGLFFLLGWFGLFFLLTRGSLGFFLFLVAVNAFLMAIWFMPVLVAFHDLSVFAALRMSFLACSRSAGAFVVFGFVMMLLHFLALLPMGLGLLLLLPVVIGSMHASYRDVFIES